MDGNQVIEFLPASSVIPPITNPLGKHWDQPDRADIDISDEYARMKPETARKLAEYSHSIPSGKYEGKMWCANWDNILYLRWYGPSDKPDELLIHTRKISLDFL